MSSKKYSYNESTNKNLKKINDDLVHISPMFKVAKLRNVLCSGHETQNQETKYAYKVLVGKLLEEWQLGRHRDRWDDNVKYV
jgi:hypothetical protein